MIDLFLEKPIWGNNDNSDLAKKREAPFNELEKNVWEVITSEGRGEARLWLCEAISSLKSISRNEQRELFMSLLRSKELKRDIVSQVLQMIFERRPRKVGAILARKCRRLEKFFQGHPKRIMQWFSTFSIEGELAHGKGAKALSQFAFVNRDICWEELEWKGKHGQSPAVVATKPHYFLDLDVQCTVENFLENVPEFWSSKEFADSLKDGEILGIDKKFFTNFFLKLTIDDDSSDMWEVISDFLTEEPYSYLCQHLLIILDELNLCVILRVLHGLLTRRREGVNFDDSSCWLEIVIWKFGDDVSIDQLFLLNALFSKGRQLLRRVLTEETGAGKDIFNDLVRRLLKNMSDSESVFPFPSDQLKAKAMEVLKWLGLLSWSLLYRLSEECDDTDFWKQLFICNKIGFRKSDAYGLLELDGESEQEETRKNKHKKRRKSEKKKKRKLHDDIFHDDELLDLDGLDDKFSHCASSRSWLLSTDGYVNPWNLADLPEHLSEHCLKEWMKMTFKDWIPAI